MYVDAKGTVGRHLDTISRFNMLEYCFYGGSGHGLS